MKITEAGFINAARELNVEVAAIKAVTWVEAAGEGFLADGRPKLLFERHKFHHFTGGKYDAMYPHLSQVKPGGYGSPTSEWQRFYQALQLDPEAAIMSASWGLGQVMGFNWKLCGEKSLYGFVFAMHNSEDAQLMMMAQYIKTTGAASFLRSRNWAGFAASYNGANYAINKYDQKLAAAYARFS